MRAAALALLALSCGAVPCRDAVDSMHVDERFTDRQMAAIGRAAAWWADVDPSLGISLERSAVVIGTPGTLAMPTKQTPERVRGRSWTHCALAIWPSGLSDDAVFRVAVHELGHFYGLSHVESGLMTPDSSKSSMCLTESESRALCLVNGCDPGALGNRCE